MAKIIGRAMLPIERNLRIIDLSPDELRARALEYRGMAACVNCEKTKDTFQLLADRFEQLAKERAAAGLLLQRQTDN